MSENYIIEQVGTELDEEISIENNYFKDLLTWGTDWTVSTLLELINKGRVDLNPKMQRRDVWKNDKKSKFIESMILGIPIPQVILAERKDKKGSYLVIDGKQRLLSLIQFFSDSKEEDIPNFKLVNLEVLKDLNGKSINEINEDSKLSTYIEILENQTIRTVVIKNWVHEEVLFSIFNRLNTGTEPLSPQELRMSLFPGEFINYINENSNKESLQKLVKSISSTAYSRMQDIELITRYYSFVHYLDKYNGRLGRFFDNSVKDLNESWKTKEYLLKQDFEKLIEIIDLNHKIFGDNYFMKPKTDNRKQKKVINKALFDLITYFLRDDELFNQVCKNVESKDKFKECLEKLFEDNRIVNEFEAHTTDFEKVKYRFISFNEILKEKFSFIIFLPW